MMVRIFASILVIAGCGGVGFSMCHQFMKEERELESLIRGLEWMILELNYRMPPLGELCMEASNRVRGNVHIVLRRFAEALEEQVTSDISLSMDRAMASVNDIPETLSIRLKDFGASAGQFDIAGQVVALESVLERCKQDHDLLRSRKEHCLRNYKTFGICSGIALVIILL